MYMSNHSIAMQKYYQANKIKLREYQLQHYKANRIDILNYHKHKPKIKYTPKRKNKLIQLNTIPNLTGVLSFN